MDMTKLTPIVMTMKMEMMISLARLLSMETGVPGTNGANVCKTAVEQEGKDDQDTASIHPRSTEEGLARGMESRHNVVLQVKPTYPQAE